jgi:hypothetical protein
MPVVLYRVDERLIHGQVVVGWGGPLNADRLIVVDDDLAASPWEQELYCLGVPAEFEAHFTTVAEAVGAGEEEPGWRLGRIMAALDNPELLRQVVSGATDPVTAADRASEALLVQRLREARPDDGIVGEEGADRAGGSGLRWVLDPLDGTVNYLYGLPAWSVSIACEDSGGTLAGVGTLDVTLYRDDLRRRPTRPLQPTELPAGGLDDALIVLVDDEHYPHVPPVVSQKITITVK